MLYLFIKVIHITAVVVWIGSLFLLSYVSSSVKSSERLTTDQIKAARRVSEAGIGLTWLAGVILVLMASWYTATWWQIKIVLVVVVSAIHTIMFRRWLQQSESTVKTTRSLLWVLVAITLLIVVLVVFKRP